MNARPMALVSGVLFLAACTVPASGSGQPSTSAVPTASNLASPTPELGDVPWMSADRTWNANEMPLAEYTILAGILGEPEPSVSLQVQMAPMADPYEMGRAPAAGIGLDGSIAYVADDGASSDVHLLAISGADVLVAELPQVVWSLAVAPDGGTIFLLLMDRATGADAGVFALPREGGALVRLLEPARIVARAGGNVLAAVVAFQGSLFPSMDGGLLARRVCSWASGPFGCALDVVDLASGEIRSFPGVFSQPVIGLSDRFLVTASDCSMELCSTIVTEIATGVQTSYEGAIDGSAVTLLDNRLVLASAARTVQPPGSRVWAQWPESGERRELLQASGETVFYLEGNLRWSAALPHGWLLVQVSQPENVSQLALWTGDGSSIALSLPNLEMSHPPAVPGG